MARESETKVSNTTYWPASFWFDLDFFSSRDYLCSGLFHKQIPLASSDVIAFPQNLRQLSIKPTEPRCIERINTRGLSPKHCGLGPLGACRFPVLQARILLIPLAPANRVASA